jgi:EAL domain-containing protein (putative c-di-GMP-specific phosphodiesterase class I)
LRAGQLIMHSQPIVDLTSNEVVGFEALMRWLRSRTWSGALECLHSSGRTERLFLELAIREAVSAANSWLRTNDHGARPYVTVNLSARQFHDGGLASMILEASRTSGLLPGRLTIETTEGVALLDVAHTLEVIEELNPLGIGIALDDLGTGFSSLSYLVLLNPRFIKIDQTFVRPYHESPHDDSPLEIIISLGNQLQMTMLAQGIENRGRIERLRAPGCELGQGSSSPRRRRPQCWTAFAEVVGKS